MTASPSPSAQRDERLQDILAVYLERLEAGQAEGQDELRARHPEFAAELAEFFSAGDRLDGLAAPLRRAAEGDPTAAPLADASGPVALGDFRLLREVGRGGMGVVYEAEQLSLRRRVALKVLPLAALADARQLQRFQNEARAAASLHHEHIVPVYAVGHERGVHYYAMQLIAGPSLAQVLAGAADPTTAYPAPPEPTADTAPAAKASTERMPRDAAYFRQVAQWGIQAAEALEHAHAMGIVHRDVKPANLMLDGAGKLWVTDFGLARMGVDTGLTVSGDLLGTLRYMSPEQALAKHGMVDHRTDVYALGATLYELLTLQPVFGGSDRQELLRQIATEDPVPPRRLNREVPAELGTVVLKALEKDPAERYGTAQELADDLRRWLEDKPIQARPPSMLQRLRKWRRRHQALVWAAAVCLLVTLAVVAGSVGWVLQERSGRQAAAEERVREALAVLEPGLREGNPHAAEVVRAARQVEAHLPNGLLGPPVRERAEQLLADLAMLATLEQIRLDQAAVKDEHFDGDGADAAYAAAFRGYKIDVEALPPAEAGARVRKRVIALHLAATLHDWVSVRSSRGKEVPGLGHLRAVAQAATPEHDRWLGPLYQGLARQASREELARVAAALPLEKLPATTLHLVAFYLSDQMAPSEATLRILRAGQRRYPADFWLNHSLAFALAQSQPPRLEEAIGFYRAALALRPESPGVHLNFGSALARKGDLDGAIAACQEALRLKPDYASAHVNLGSALLNKGLVEEAIAEYRKALRLKPNEAMAHSGLGGALRQKGRLDEAIAACREALRLEKDFPLAQCALGVALRDKGDLDGAIAAIREAIRLKKDYPWAHTSLGAALQAKGLLDEAIAEHREAIRLKKDFAEAHYNLGVALWDKGQLEEAIAAFREAIRLKKDFAEVHHNLSVTLRDKGLLDDAIAAAREAIRLKKDYPEAHNSLGVALRGKGRLDEAIAEYREAIRLKKDFPWAHTNLGNALQAKGRLDDAIAEYRKAIRLKKGFAEAHNNLSVTLRKKGVLDEAIAAAREAIRLKKDYPEAHYNLGTALGDKGQLDGAIAAFREAIRLKKDYPWAHTDLGSILQAKGRLDEAIAEHREALRLKKDFAEAHYSLGNALSRKGQLDEAIAAYREAIRLKKDYASSYGALGQALLRKGRFAEARRATQHALALLPPGHPLRRLVSGQLEQCECLLALEARLPDIVSGKGQPVDAAERVGLAVVCHLKGLYRQATRFYEEALGADPKLNGDRPSGVRYNAACAAALTGCGQGDDAAKPDAKERARLRKQALDWLRADLTARSQAADKRLDKLAPFVVNEMRRWQQDKDFAGVRDPGALAKLPQAERQAWQKLWTDVADRLARAQRAPAKKQAGPK